ncbi:hypothetical protein [Frankia sp. CiP3]|uniref:hypothetical protein n=1 Tax=Frankia sp. CiP3 TaxID=2880971 RepID=UPI001EF50D91|nr:hypothetical protein [Frankia sp. CiP3]
MSGEATTAAESAAWSGHVALDAAAWAELCAAVPGVVVPADFLTSWDAVPNADRLRASARSRLAGSGLVDAEGHPDPRVVELLTALGSTPVRIRLRSGVGDRVVLAALASGWDTTVALTRARRVHGPADPTAVGEDGAVVDLAAFPSSELADRLWTLLPPDLTERALQPGQTAGEAAELSWESVVALLQALRQGPSWPVEVRGEVRHQLLELAGLGELPETVTALAPRLAGAVDLTVTLLVGTAAERQWRGLWLLTGDHRVITFVEPWTGVPADGGHGIRLLEVDGRSLRRDILRTLAEVFDALAQVTETYGRGRA